jgi:hypothetical protein
VWDSVRDSMWHGVLTSLNFAYGPAKYLILLEVAW